MRRLLAMVAAASFVFAAASAQAASHRLTLSVTGFTVLYGHQVTVAGRFTNGHAGQKVTILARTFDMKSLQPVATVVTGKGGSFRWLAHPTIQTSYSARLGAWRSRTLTIGVRPILTLGELTNGEVRAQVQAAKSFRGRLVKLQQQQADGSWKTVVQRALGPNSTVTFAPTLASSRLRLALSVNEAGRGYLGGYSHSIGYTAYNLTLVPANSTVLYGKSVELAGHLLNGKAGEPVELYAKPFGQSTAIHLATATTAAGGWWSFRVSPRILTRYQATWSGTEHSAWVPVGVKPLITVHELANGQVRVHVQAGRSFRGREIRLQQQQANGSWRTVMKAPLDAGSNATFTPTFAGSWVRAALSVNQAGKGYLGGFSDLLSYRVR
ncbi:MAG TPA: hypothetical protein VFJ91_07145 [Gaiellaceae bacterium]|nr:hypothetical protein [Gaiellaceae bacterium]